jgi:hypothetical protein
MLRRLSIGLLASSVAIAPLPLKADDGSAEDLGDVMSISLKDVVNPTFGFQGALQGAGTPNQAGIGGFLPLSVSDNSVWFLDALVNANFADRESESSIVNTDVAGVTISTSTRVGYRWLNSDRSWMYGLNAGYDSRPMNSGGTDTGIPLFGTEQNVFFQQAALSIEMISKNWDLNAYALIPIGETEQRLNWLFKAGALDTFGLDVGYFITDQLSASVGYYYQQGDLGSGDSSGIKAGLELNIADDVQLGVDYSYDERFEARLSADLSVRFETFRYSDSRPGIKKLTKSPQIKGLSRSPNHRDIRVHDVVELDALDPLAGPVLDGVTNSVSGQVEYAYGKDDCDYSKPKEKSEGDCTTRMYVGSTYTNVYGYNKCLKGKKPDVQQGKEDFGYRYDGKCFKGRISPDREGVRTIPEKDWMKENFPDS